MGRLKGGKWVDGWFDSDEESGTFVRPDSHFRNWISDDPAARFTAEADRYHLYISYACPWAHRTLIVRNLKGLDSIIGLSIVDPVFKDGDWTFSEGQGCIADSINHSSFLHEIYQKAAPDYSGIVTVPTLWDKKFETIVSNESSDIIRMFNSAFSRFASSGSDYYPENLRSEIDAVNKRVYNFVNNGVYRAGFAHSQSGYEKAVRSLFETLDWLEMRLSQQRYMLGNRITEADWRLFTTLVRFDSVYFGHFKCNLRPLTSYSNLWAYTRDLFQQEGVAETINMDHIKRHYYSSHEEINPSRIVPLGPTLDFFEPHNRSSLA